MLSLLRLMAKCILCDGTGKVAGFKCRFCNGTGQS